MILSSKQVVKPDQAGRRIAVGSAIARTGPGFTNYAADNIRAKCNAQEVEITRLWYKSKADFKGRDQVQSEAFFSTGSSIKTTLQITVR